MDLERKDILAEIEALKTELIDAEKLLNTTEKLYIDKFSTYKIGDLLKIKSSRMREKFKAVCVTKIEPLTSWRSIWHREYPKDGFIYTFTLFTRAEKLHANGNYVNAYSEDIEVIGKFDIENNKRIR